MRIPTPFRLVAGVILLLIGLALFWREDGTLAWLAYCAGAVLVFTVILPLLKRHGADPYAVDRD